MILETGDIILTSRNSIIVMFMRLFQKDPVFWGHVLVAKDSTTLWEAHWRLREISALKVFEKHKYYKIIRKKDITEEQKNTMCKLAPTLLGHYYGVFRIGLQMLDHIFHTDWFTDHNTNEAIQVCSSFAAWIYYHSCDGYKFNNKDWESCDPDDIEDEYLINHTEWTDIIEKSLPKWVKKRIMRKITKRNLKYGKF